LTARRAPSKQRRHRRESRQGYQDAEVRSSRIPQPWKQRPRPARSIMPEIPPSEELMREDGALKRKLVVYCEVTDRLTAGHDLPLDSFHQAAHLVHEYPEGFHGGLEQG